MSKSCDRQLSKQQSLAASDSQQSISKLCSAYCRQRFVIHLSLWFLAPHQLLVHLADLIFASFTQPITSVWWMSVTRSIPRSPMPFKYILMHSCLDNWRSQPVFDQGDDRNALLASEIPSSLVVPVTSVLLEVAWQTVAIGISLGLEHLIN